MTKPNQPAKPRTKAMKMKPEKGGAISDASLNKVSGGNMPTSVEHSAGTGGGSGRS